MKKLKFKYKYYVVYFIPNGDGRIFITMNKKIKTRKDIEELEKIISNAYDNETVVIINWVRLKG